MHDEHTNCPCNGAYLCGPCHQGWAHKHPKAAMDTGFIVSRHVAEPSTVPVHSWYGVLLLKCDGMIEFETGAT